MRIGTWVVAGALLLGCGPAEPRWSLLQLGTATEDEGVGIAVDREGNVLVAANTLGTWDAPAAAARPQDALLLKLTAEGEVAWARQFGSEAADAVRTLVLTDDGDVAIGGSAGGPLPGATALGDLDAFAARFAPDGARVWSRQWGTPGADNVNQLFTRGSELLAAGSQTGDGADMWLGVLDAEGAIIDDAWFGTDAPDIANAVAWQEDGSAAYLVGGTLGDFAGAANRGSFDAVALRLDGITTPVWTHSLATSDIDGAIAAATVPNGGVYVIAVSFADLETGAPEQDGRQSSWLVRYSNAGERLWMRRWQPAEVHGRAQSLVVAPDGTIVVAGLTAGETEGGLDARLVRYDIAGEILWSRQWGTAVDDQLRSVTLTPSGDILVVGTTGAELQPGAHAGDKDLFIARLTADGEPTW